MTQQNSIFVREREHDMGKNLNKKTTIKKPWPKCTTAKCKKDAAVSRRKHPESEEREHFCADHWKTAPNNGDAKKKALIKSGKKVGVLAPKKTLKKK